ncbi:MAG: trans-aconitate 2-methyltransferase [Spirulina sp.]
MNPGHQSLIYHHPEIYELVYPDPQHFRAKMFEEIFARNLPEYPTSILDIGCGTARDIAYLANTCQDCLGVDYHEQYVRFARSRYPNLLFQQGDIRTLQLGRSFAAIVCSGSVLCHLTETKDLKKAFQTFANHSHPGTLLIVGIYNAFSGVGKARIEAEYEIPSGDYAGKSRATFEFLPLQQRLIGKRIWDIPILNDEEKEDSLEMRVFAPMELEYYLNDFGFQVVEKFDTAGGKNLHPLACTLFIASVFQN